MFRLLTFEPAMDFLDSMIFWDEKRPITARVLRKLNIRDLARELGCEGRYMQFVRAPAGKQTGHSRRIMSTITASAVRADVPSY